MHMELVLDCLHNNSFYVKLSKYLFCQDSIDHIGHIVSFQGWYAAPNRLKTMVKWHIPTTMKHLQGFLDLTGYYC